MRELAVSTQTTPVELANLFNGLLPDNIIGGKPGADGAVVLYGSNDEQASRHPPSVRAIIAARVAIDVVLQQVDGMPGAQPLAGYIREQLAGNGATRAGLLAPPLTLLAQLYCRTTGAMPDGSLPGRMALLPGSDLFDSDEYEEPAVTPEQQQALETLIDRLMQLPCRSREPDRH